MEVRLIASHARSGAAVFTVGGELRRVAEGESLGVPGLRLLHASPSSAVVLHERHGAPPVEHLVRPGEALDLQVPVEPASTVRTVTVLKHVGDHDD